MGAEGEVIHLHVLTAATDLLPIILIDKGDVPFSIRHHSRIGRAVGGHLITGPAGQEALRCRIIGRRRQDFPIDRDMASTLHIALTAFGIAERNGLQCDMNRFSVTTLRWKNQNLTICGIVLSGRTTLQRGGGNRFGPFTSGTIGGCIVENIEVAATQHPATQQYPPVG